MVYLCRSKCTNFNWNIWAKKGMHDKYISPMDPMKNVGKISGFCCPLKNPIENTYGNPFVCFFFPIDKLDPRSRVRMRMRMIHDDPC